MQYQNPIVPGIFLSRPNRFIAHVLIDGKEEICHVKNTGRCRELLPQGAKVYCADCLSPSRKTRYDLIAVEKNGQIINMDSQAPNAAVGTFLRNGGLGEISGLKPETVFGRSRFDFSFQKDGKQCFLEVKGVTLENGGVCAFPDAPTQRGTKHLQELAALSKAGYGCFVLFAVQMEKAICLIPNEGTDPAFAQALRDAEKAGVTLLAYTCSVTPGTMHLSAPLPIRL